MGTVVVVVVVALVAFLVYKLVQAPDKNGDGKVDAQDVVIAAKEVAADVKAGGEKAVEKVKKARKKKAE